jgi:hypothetical protein
MNRSVFLPIFAAIAGLAGALLRRYELLNAFETDSGLAISGHPATIAMLVLSGAVLLLTLLFLPKNQKIPESLNFAQAFSVEDKGTRFLIVVAALLLLACAVCGAYQYLEGSETRVSRLVLFVFAALSALSVLFTGLRAGQGSGEQSSILLLFPAFFACLWLVLVYQNHAADPVLLDYVFELLAVVCVVLSLYSIAGFGFGRGRVRATSFYCLMGVYFSMVTLADSHTLPFLLLYLFAAVYLELSSGILLLNASRPRNA